MKQDSSEESNFLSLLPEMEVIQNTLAELRDVSTSRSSLVTTVLENLVDYIMIINKDLKIEYANSVLANRLGYEKGEIVHKHAFDIVHADFIPVIEGDLCGDGCDRIQEYLVSLVAKDTRSFDAVLRSIPVIESGGRHTKSVFAMKEPYSRESSDGMTYALEQELLNMGIVNRDQIEKAAQNIRCRLAQQTLQGDRLSVRKVLAN